MARCAFMKICTFEIALDRGRVEDSSAQATGFVSTIMHKSDHGVAVSNVLANSHDKVFLVLTFCLGLMALGSIDAIHANGEEERVGPIRRCQN